MDDQKCIDIEKIENIALQVFHTVMVHSEQHGIKVKSVYMNAEKCEIEVIRKESDPKSFFTAKFEFFARKFNSHA